MSKQTVSAVILTKNEENNVERCLSSLDWCDEIIIVDDFSEDKTLEKIRNPEAEIRNKVKIYQRKLDANFAAQRNFGLDKATGELVLFVDADEIIPKSLAKEIVEKIKEASINGWIFKRQDIIFGKELHYGETANVELLRLGKREKGSWEGRVHEEWMIRGQTGNLQNPILHYPHPTVSEFLQDVNWYTDLVVQCWKEQGRKMEWWQIPLYPLGKFISNYIMKQGFRDGTAGFVMAAFMSFHSFLARGKYWLATHQ